MWSVVTLARLRDLQSKQRWSEGAFSIIFVEITGHELRTVWRRSKLKNIVWHSSHYRHIAFLKRTHKQVEIRYSVLYKTTCIHSERILIPRLLLLKADVSGVSPSSERLEELWVLCAFLCRKWSCTIGWEYGEEKTRINHYNIQSILY